MRPRSTFARLRRSGFPVALTVTLLCGVVVAREQPADAPPESKPDSIRGRIIGDGEKPIAGALVGAYVEKPADASNFRVSAISDRNGEFVLPGVANGVTRILVRAPSFVLVDGIPEGVVRAGSVLAIRMAKGAAITGRVVDRAGIPITGIRVVPEIIRDEKGVRTRPLVLAHRGAYTDDRGEYRVFGLEAGTYLVLAGGRSNDYERQMFLSDRLPTYYPSEPRSSARPIDVRLGADVTQVDIVFRGEYGHRIAGSTVGGDLKSGWTRVELYRANEVEQIRNDDVTKRRGDPRFSFDDLEDGDYELLATSSNSEDVDLTSGRVTIRVRGADVTGIELKLLPAERSKKD